MPRIRTAAATLLLTAASAAVIASTQVGSSALAAAAPASATTQSVAGTNAAPVTIAVRKGALGSFLVGKGGRTVYLWVADHKNVSECTGTCATYWPAVTGTAKAGAGVARSALGSLKRADGTRQVTFHGHPLYYFAGDTKVGATAGQGSDGFGARWWVLSPAGKAITAAPATLTITAHKGSAGTYLVGKGGRAIYLWVADPKNASECTGTCATYWPAVTGTVKAGAGVSQSAFGSFKRADGKTQLTYHGHALYYFAGDPTAGTTAGQGSDGFGAQWWLVSTAGEAITVNG